MSTVRVFTTPGDDVKIAGFEEICRMCDVSKNMISDVQNLVAKGFVNRDQRLEEAQKNIRGTIARAIGEKENLWDGLPQVSQSQWEIGRSFFVLYHDFRRLLFAAIHSDGSKYPEWNDGCNDGIYKFQIDLPSPERIVPREAMHAIFAKLIREGIVTDRDTIAEGKKAFASPRQCDLMLSFLRRNPRIAELFGKIRNVNSISRLDIPPCFVQEDPHGFSPLSHRSRSFR